MTPHTSRLYVALALVLVEHASALLHAPPRLATQPTNARHHHCQPALGAAAAAARATRQPRCVAPDEVEGGETPDLDGLDFEERLAALAKQYENAVPVDPEEEKLKESDRDWDEDEKWWNPAFWSALSEDVKDVEWPTPKKVVQTFLISQAAFVLVVVLTLLADALFDASIRSIVQGEPFTITLDRILKVSQNTGPM